MYGEFPPRLRMYSCVYSCCVLVRLRMFTVYSCCADVLVLVCICSMLMGYVMAFKVPRFMINTLVPFLVADLGLPSTVTPTLLAAFHPGYILTQVPGGLLVSSKGPAFVATLQLAGSAALLALIPAAGALGTQRMKVLAMSTLMLGMGAFQGPMSPVQSQIARDWMPAGVERAWAYRMLSLSHSSTPLLAALFTPRIANRFGWRTVCYLYAAAAAAYTSLFMLLATDKPVPRLAAPHVAAGGAEKSGAEKEAQQQAAVDVEKEKKKFDWRILRTKPALALMAFHIAADFGEFTRHQLAPTMYMEKFGCVQCIY